MKKFGLPFAAIIFVFLFAGNSFGQCSGGKIDGIYHTSCYPWINGDGYISGTFTQNDTPRLTRALTAAFGKILFDEADYFINDSLPVYSYRTIEGTGKGTYYAPPLPNPLPNPTPTPAVASHLTSKIIQTANNKSIFKIGEGIYSVSIRDLALVGRTGTSGTIGILGEGGDVGNVSSLSFQFSNLVFDNPYRGIYVNAKDNPNVPGNNTGEWQMDHIRIDHIFFIGCRIGLHMNSYNSGMNISSLDFLIPEGGLPTDTFENRTYGIYLERSTYTTMDLLIGNGPSSAGPALATGLIYVKEHANLTIQGMIAEGFREDINIEGNTRNYPINLMNNTFMNGVTVKDATLYSTGNQYSAINNNGAFAVAKGSALVYSIGDKFCTEGNSSCDEGRGFTLQEQASVVYSSNQKKNTTSVPFFMSNYVNIARDTYDSTPNLSIVAPNYAGGTLLRLGRGSYWYDITRDETNGNLNFEGNQANYGGYTFKTQGGAVTVNYDGSVTFGTVSAAGLGSKPNGTTVYCGDCQRTDPCSSGGSGAMAKRINGIWICN